ncbi:MAG: 2Fe-2S iron-sulfur cluster-binding protein, partial [Gammaproteobacteria bacterium]
MVAITAKPIRFTLDARELDANPGETILQAAHRAGIEIPYLCYKEGYRPDGNCRA